MSPAVNFEETMNPPANYEDPMNPPGNYEDPIHPAVNFVAFGKEKSTTQSPKPSNSSRNNRLLVFSKENNDDLQKLRAEAIKQSMAIAAEEHAMKKEMHGRNLRKIDLECRVLELDILEKQRELNEEVPFRH